MTLPVLGPLTALLANLFPDSRFRRVLEVGQGGAPHTASCACACRLFSPPRSAPRRPHGMQAEC